MDKLIQGKEKIRYHDHNDWTAMAARVKSIGIGNVIQKGLGKSNLSENQTRSRKKGKKDSPNKSQRTTIKPQLPQTTHINETSHRFNPAAQCFISKQDPSRT